MKTKDILCCLERDMKTYSAVMKKMKKNPFECHICDMCPLVDRCIEEVKRG